MCFEGKGMVMGKMSEMMKECDPEMMMAMMPQCLELMVENLPEEKRKDFVLKIMEILLEKGHEDRHEEDQEPGNPKDTVPPRARTNRRVLDCVSYAGFVRRHG